MHLSKILLFLINKKSKNEGFFFYCFLKNKTFTEQKKAEAIGIDRS